MSRGSQSRMITGYHWQDLVHDVGTYEWILTREMLADGDREGWKCDSVCLRQLAWSAFAGTPESKTTCENTFGWLQDSAARQSKMNKMRLNTKYLYLQTCPYGAEGGSKLIVPTSADILGIDREDYQDCFVD